MVFPIFMFCQDTKHESDTFEEIQKIQIKAVDFLTFTIISIDCDKFEEYLSNITSKSITDTTVIRELLSHIEKFEPIDSTYSKQIDTRAKIHMISKNDTTTICIGYFFLYINDHTYKTTPEFIDFLEKIK